MLRKAGVPRRVAQGLYVLSASLVALTVSATITLTTQKNRRPPGSPTPHYHTTMRKRSGPRKADSK